MQVFPMPHHALKAVSLEPPLGVGEASVAPISRAEEGMRSLGLPAASSWANQQSCLSVNFLDAVTV